MKAPGFFLLALLLVFFSCAEQTPKDVLPKARMKLVLYDLLRADEFAGQLAQGDSAWTKLDAHADLYQKVFQVQQVTRDQFRNSLRYYESHPQELKPLLEELQVYAEERQRSDTSHRIRKAPGDTGIRAIPEGAGL